MIDTLEERMAFLARKDAYVDTEVQIAEVVTHHLLELQRSAAMLTDLFTPGRSKNVNWKKAITEKLTSFLDLSLLAMYHLSIPAPENEATSDLMEEFDEEVQGDCILALCVIVRAAADSIVDLWHLEELAEFDYSIIELNLAEAISAVFIIAENCEIDIMDIVSAKIPDLGDDT